MYLSEIALIRYRGSLSTMNTVAMNLFVAVSLLCAALLPFSYFIIAAGVPACLFLSFAIFIPESPIWYAKKGLFEEARKSLEWLRGSKYQLKEELEEMERLLAIKQNWKDSVKEMTQRKFIFPIIMLIFFMFIQPFSGIIMISAFILDIFRRAKITFNHYLLSILTTGATTTGYVISTFLMNRLPRKTHFTMGGIGMAASLLTGGIILKLQVQYH